MRSRWCGASCQRSRILRVTEQIPTLYAPEYPQDIPQKRSMGTPVAWFISYQHLLRSDEAGVKFVLDQAAAIAEGQHLERLGYVVTRIAKSPKAVRARSAALVSA